ncbi:hypothetical protein KKC60_04180 [Patescibacteria group bacterium]|nr:hypothetical protein [Patescibacteria group bacterium]
MANQNTPQDKNAQDPFKALNKKVAPPGALDEVLTPKEAPRKNPLKKKTQPQAPESDLPVSPAPVDDSAPQGKEESPEGPLAQKKVEPFSSSPDETAGIPPLKEAGPGGGDEAFKSLSDSQVAASERKTVLSKIITVFVVLVLLAGFTWAGIFAYNKWIKPSVNGEKEASKEATTQDETQNNDNAQVEVSPDQDTDQDGLPDEWEIKFGLSINDSADALDDSDFDQLKNKDEYKYGTNPQNPDTDKDGFRDGVEVQGGFNPNGEGKLENGAASATDQDFRTVAGDWGGNFNGATLSASDLEFTLKDDGSILGTYNFAGSGDVKIFSRAKGTFTYSKSSYVFKGDLRVKGFYEQEGVDYTLKLEGQTLNAREMTGTWTVTPDREVPWLPQDRGTFKLSK